MELELNRRSFVAAGTLAASGIAFAEAAASETLAPQTALAEEAAQDGGADIGPIAPVDVPASWDFEADVVVVGAGGGGLNAAARCAELDYQEGAFSSLALVICGIMTSLMAPFIFPVILAMMG